MEGYEKWGWMSQYQLPNHSLPATNMASPPAHWLHNHLGQQNMRITLKHDCSLMREIIIHTDKQTQLLSQSAGYKYHRILSILHPGKQRVSRINNLCKREKVVRSNNAYRQSRSVRLVFREGCHWLISTWQPCWRGKKKKSWTGKISLGLRQMYFYNNNFEGWETVRQGETQILFVTILELKWVVG